MELISIILFVLFLVAFGVSIFLFFQLQTTKNEVKEAGKLSETEAIEKASSKAKKKILNAEEEATQIISQAQKQANEIRSQVTESEKRLNQREQKLLERSNTLDQKFDEIEKKEFSIEQSKKDVKALRLKLSTQLEEIAGLTRTEAKKQLEEEIDSELTSWKAKRIRETESKIQNETEEKAAQVLADAMANAAVDYVADTTQTTLPIEDDNMISRIIGKSGRNIRTLQNLTGADIVIEENPSEVTISCFDPIRREVAALVLQQLMKSGKISPVTIEETVEKVKKSVLKEIKETGEHMAFESGIADLPDELIMLLGRFKYRFSYGQNMVKHTLEVVKIGEELAKELHADVRITKLACLLHDLGKVAPEDGKQHHHISADLARKYFKNNDVLANAIEAHHFDIDANYLEAEIVRIADAISGSRPGARRNDYEEYIKRIRALEDIATKRKGVKEAFALQAGREVRVVVKPNQVSDDEAKVLAHDIAKEIQETQSYPGVVRVNVIRESRVTAEAK